MASMSRNRLFLVAGSLAVAAAVSLISGITLLNRDVGSYIASHYRQESRDVNGTRYLCTGSPKQVATTLVKYQTPAARASHTDTEYLRYRNNIVTVGPTAPIRASSASKTSAPDITTAHMSSWALDSPLGPRRAVRGSPGGPGGSK